MIRLTERNPNQPGATKPRWFNPNHIRSATPTEDGSQTVVVVGADKPETVWVDETPERIIELAEQAEAKSAAARIGPVGDVLIAALDQIQERIRNAAPPFPTGAPVATPPVPKSGEELTFALDEGPSHEPAVVAVPVVAAVVSENPDGSVTAVVVDPNDKPVDPPSGKHARNHGGGGPPMPSTDEPLSDAV